jgi:hypothetical protein
MLWVLSVLCGGVVRLTDELGLYSCHGGKGGICWRWLVATCV